MGKAEKTPVPAESLVPESAPAEAASPLAIKIDNVSKTYGMSLRFNWKTWLRFFTSGRLGAFRDQAGTMAVDGFSLDIRKGELIGIIGRNGAGKSTLLKLISGVSQVNGGRIEVDGTVFPMIELNAGMNPSLSGRENVRLLATIMGMSRKELDERMDDIEDFCDLGEWFDRPVRQYSKGMPGRLGFAVAVHTSADILLIDEILAVGDINFRERCSRKMEELRDAGKTVVLVSHNMTAITHLCSRAAVIEQGKLAFVGPSEKAVKFYTDYMRTLALRKLQKSLKQAIAVESKEGIKISAVGVADSRDVATNTINAEHGMKVWFDYELNKDFGGGNAFIRILSEKGAMVVEEMYELNTTSKNQSRYLFHFHKGLALPTGRYQLQVGVHGPYSDSGELAVAETEFTVINQKRLGTGVISPPFKVINGSIDKFAALTKAK